MEWYIREQFPSVIKSKENLNGQKLNEGQKSFIFGEKYASNEENFMFVQGEQILIKEIATHVKGKLEAADNADYFSSKPSRRLKNFKPKNTVNTAIGLIYCDATTKTGPAKKVTERAIVWPVDNLKQKLLETVLEYLSKSHLQYSSEDVSKLMNVNSNDVPSINGSVICPLCSKNNQVYLKTSQSSFSWVISNFKRHFSKCCLNGIDQAKKGLKSTSCIPTDSIPEKSEEFTNLTNILKSQITVQNIKIGNSIIINNENISTCKLESGHKIHAINLQRDGNCLFSAAAHQLNFVKVGSDEHKSLTKELRRDCVMHMKNNIEFYKKDIEQRILEKNPEKNVFSSEDYTAFFDNYLSKDNKWGGAETIRAIVMMFQVNIIVFNEKGSVYFARLFDLNHNRTIMIAFRIADPLNEDTSNKNRNHYDSVAKVENNIISLSADNLIKDYLKSCSLKTSNEKLELE